MFDATAKDENTFPALKYQVNILYPPTAKGANKSHHGEPALPRLPLNQTSSDSTDKTRQPKSPETASHFHGHLFKLVQPPIWDERPYNQVKMGL